MEHFISTSDRRRKRLWERLFGTAVLPVLSPQPRMQEHVGGTVLAYDLALAELHAGDRWRLASHISSRYGMAYADALARVETAVSWPLVDEGDLFVVETAEEIRPFPVFRPALAWGAALCR